MGNYFNKSHCCVCGSDGYDYSNPLIKFMAIGKRNGEVRCYKCISSLVLQNNKNKYIVYD